MSFKDLPPDTLPALLARGAGALSDAELLAILLRTGLAGCGVLQLAHTILPQQAGWRGCSTPACATWPASKAWGRPSNPKFWP